MRWSSAVQPMVRRNVSLAEYTTFRIGGTARYFIAPTSEREFAAAYREATSSGWPVHILGGGSNLLVSDDGIDGIVLCTSGLRDVAPEVRGTRICARAGTPLGRVIQHAAREGLSGLEGMAGIPGTIGGAVRMNAGARNTSIGEWVDAIWCATADGCLVRLSGREVEWGYRCAHINDPIVRVDLSLCAGRPASIRQRIRRTVRAKRSAQPTHLPSAGCFFKNPEGDSAGRLIDKEGLKGLSVGKAQVSFQHANFVVNTGGASASDVWQLCHTVRTRVQGRFGIELEPEVCVWPAFGS